MKLYTISLFILICLLSSCKEEEDLGIPYKIIAVEEIQNGTSVNKILEMPTCRLDDEFYFSDNNELRILLSESKCPAIPGESVDGSWEVSTNDSLQIDFLDFKLVNIYIIHDSIRMSPTHDQWINGNQSQRYQIIQFDENEITFRSIKNVSLPNTTNYWQIKLKKD